MQTAGLQPSDVGGGNDGYYDGGYDMTVVIMIVLVKVGNCLSAVNFLSASKHRPRFMKPSVRRSRPYLGFC